MRQPPLTKGVGDGDKRHWTARLILILALILIAGVCWVAVARATPDCTALAHRGVHNPRIDENTAEAAAAASKVHAWLDADLRVTSDGVGVLMHDRNVNRTTTGFGMVEDHDAAWVAGLRTEPNGQAVPTWSDYLAAAGSTQIVVELKHDVQDWTDAEIQTVVAQASGHTVYFGEFPHIAEVAPDALTYWRPDLDEPVTRAVLTKRSVDVVLGFPGSFDPAKVRRLTAHGYVLGSRMSGDVEEWQAAYDAGLRLLTTNKPAALNHWCAA
jgi:glycerophosphoryl diester phosphodiesterase